MHTQQPANQRRPAAFGLKKAAAWLYRHPLAVELLVLAAVVALIALPEVLV